MGGVAEFLGMIMGAILAVYCLSRFINFCIKKKTKLDNEKQRLIATISGTFIAIIIFTLVSIMINKNIYSIIGTNFFYIIGGLIAVFYFALNLGIKPLVLAFLYGAFLWLIATLLINGILVMVCSSMNQKIASVNGFIVYIISLAVSSILVVKQKLPWTRRKNI